MRIERKLLYSLKGSNVRKEIVVRIDAPYIVDQNKVDFLVGEGLVGCHIEVVGLPEKYDHEVYGVDELQAINMASDVEPLLKRLQKNTTYSGHRANLTSRTEQPIALSS